MRILGIDTSAAATGVALVVDGRLERRLEEDLAPSHSRRLLPLVVELLGGGQDRLAELDAIGVAAGPGSFTGLRVGLATANALAWSLERIVVPVSSLEALAFEARGFARPVVAVLDARRSEVFAARFEPREGGLVRTVEDRVCTPEEAFRGLVRPGDIVLGEGAARYRLLLEALRPEASLVASSSSAEGVARLAGAQLERRAGRPGFALPIYLRKPDAELAPVT